MDPWAASQAGRKPLTSKHIEYYNMFDVLYLRFLAQNWTPTYITPSLRLRNSPENKSGRLGFFYFIQCEGGQIPATNPPGYYLTPIFFWRRRSRRRRNLMKKKSAAITANTISSWQEAFLQYIILRIAMLWKKTTTNLSNNRQAPRRNKR